MLVNVPHLEWQVLRAILRHKGPGGCPGSALRIIPSRRTKNGVHLTALEKAGLIEAAGPPAPPEPDAAGLGEETAEPLRTKWRLTNLGRHAAEYGEYDDGRGGLSLPTPEEFEAAKRSEGRKKKSS